MKCGETLELDTDKDPNPARSRSYDPGLGQWISRDPMGYIETFNDRAYASDSPTNRTDSYGTVSADDYKAIASAALSDFHAKISKYAYSDPSGIDAFLLRERQLLLKLSISRNALTMGSKSASYGSNSMTIRDPEAIDSLELSHELVHAIADVEGHWYQGLSSDVLSKNEGLAYGAEYILSKAEALQGLEDDINANGSPKQILRDWDSAWNGINSIDRQVAWYPVASAQKTRQMTEDDLADVKAKLGIHLSYGQLVHIYQALICDKKIDVTLPHEKELKDVFK